MVHLLQFGQRPGIFSRFDDDDDDRYGRSSRICHSYVAVVHYADGQETAHYGFGTSGSSYCGRRSYVSSYGSMGSGSSYGGGYYRGSSGGGGSSSGGYSGNRSTSTKATASNSGSGQESTQASGDLDDSDNHESSSSAIAKISSCTQDSTSPSDNSGESRISSLYLAVSSSGNGQVATYTTSSPGMTFSPTYGLEFGYATDEDFINGFLATFGHDFDADSVILPPAPSTSTIIEDVSHVEDEPINAGQDVLNSSGEQFNGFNSEARYDSSGALKITDEQGTIASTVLATYNNGNMKPFPTSSRLQKSNLTCRRCNEKFLNQFTLNRHEKEQHGIREGFPCPYPTCKRSEPGQVFKRKAHLIRHIVTCKHRVNQSNVVTCDKPPLSALVTLKVPEDRGTRELLESGQQKPKNSLQKNQNNQNNQVGNGIQRLKQEHTSLSERIETKKQELVMMKAKEESLKQDIEKDRLVLETIAHCIRLQTMEDRN